MLFFSLKGERGNGPIPHLHVREAGRRVEDCDAGLGAIELKVFLRNTLLSHYRNLKRISL